MSRWLYFFGRVCCEICAISTILFDMIKIVICLCEGVLEDADLSFDCATDGNGDVQFPFATKTTK